MQIESIEEVVALYALRRLSSDDLPEIAIALMGWGVELPAIAALAGATPGDTPGDRWDLFEEAIRKLKCQIPDKLSAAHVLKRVYARRGARSPAAAPAAASQIMDLYYLVYELLPKSTSGIAGAEFGIHSLLGTYYAYDDLPLSDATAEAELALLLQDECRVLAEEPAPN